MSKPIGYYQDQYGMHPIFPPGDHNHDGLYLGISAKAADSDKLDNHDSSYFAQASQSVILDNRAAGDVIPGDLPEKSIFYTFTDDIVGSPNTWDAVINVKGWGEGYAAWQLFANSSRDDNNPHLYFRRGRGATWGTLQKVWTDQNDGSGSGLDADKLDGSHASAFSLTSHNHSGVYLPIAGKAADSQKLDGIDSLSFVRDTGNETIAGIKTFSSFPVTPSSAPGSNYQVANKKYVDDASPSVGDGTITQAKLKTSFDEISTSLTTAALFILPGGQYAFMLNTRGSDAAAKIKILEWNSMSTAIGVAYANKVFMASNLGSDTVYARTRYVTSSGEVFWVFALRAKVDIPEPTPEEPDYFHPMGKIVCCCVAPDHPCFGNGADPNKVSHPFSDFDTTQYELVVINPTKEQVQQIEEAQLDQDGLLRSDTSFIEEMWNLFEIDEKSTPEWPNVPVTVGIKEPASLMAGEEVTTVKKIIPDLRQKLRGDIVVLKSLKSRDELLSK